MIIREWAGMPDIVMW